MDQPAVLIDPNVRDLIINVVAIALLSISLGLVIHYGIHPSLGKIIQTQVATYLRHRLFAAAYLLRFAPRQGSNPWLYSL